jgi:predicted oxidoreductase
VHQIALLNNVYPLAYHQIEISPLQLQSYHNGDLEFCLMHNIMPMAWSPLGGGLLFNEDNKIFKAASRLASKYHTNVDTLLYSWLRLHPAGIVPVTGTTKNERIQYAVNSENISISKEDWYLLYTAAIGKEVA